MKRNTTQQSGRAVGYIRVSSEEQAESGAGMDAQRDALVACAKRMGLELVATYADEAVSGSKSLDDREGLLGAIDFMGEGDVILVSKRDRIGRGDPVLVAMIERAVQRKGGRIVSAAGEGTDDDSPANILMRRMIDAFAEYELLVIRARTKAALAAKKARGERVGGIPWGSRISKKSARKLAVDEDEAAAVRHIVREHRSGKSLREIVTSLEEAGHKPRGKCWFPMTVKRIIENNAEEVAA